jgi:hypothetical protein
MARHQNRRIGLPGQRRNFLIVLLLLVIRFDVAPQLSDPCVGQNVQPPSDSGINVTRRRTERTGRTRCGAAFIGIPPEHRLWVQCFADLQLLARPAP